MPRAVCSTGSPCIDAGTNDPPGGLPLVDIDGNARPLDGNGDGKAVADMGAWEHPAVPAQEQDPRQLLENLTKAVTDLRLPQRTADSLNAKLKTAQKALEKRNEKNDITAANACSRRSSTAVQAQRGKKIPQAGADALIAAAQQIIDLLTGT